MKNKFKEYYSLTDDEIKDFWTNAIFSFDANVLLNLYRYTEATRDEVLDTLEFLQKKKRLWISYQAAFEYHKNRFAVINKLITAYDELSEKLTKKINELEADLNNHKKHPYLRTDELFKRITNSIKKVKNELHNLKKQHPNFFEDDPIFNDLTEILNDCIGDQFSPGELSAIYKEGKERYENKTPPGYMDKEKEKNGEQSLYGDLIIWKELLKKANETTSNFIFITDDTKEDWWFIFNGKTIYARPELIKEFRTLTNKEIIIYKTEQFLKYFKLYLRQEIKEETLKEVEEVRKIDELISINFTDFKDKLREATEKLNLEQTDWRATYKNFQDIYNIKLGEEFQNLKYTVPVIWDNINLPRSNKLTYNSLLDAWNNLSLPSESLNISFNQRLNDLMAGIVDQKIGEPKLATENSKPQPKVIASREIKKSRKLNKKTGSTKKQK